MTLVAFHPRRESPALPDPELKWPDRINRTVLPAGVAALLIHTPQETLLLVDSAQTEPSAWLAIGMVLGESRKANVAVITRADVAEAEKRLGYIRALPWAPA